MYFIFNDQIFFKDKKKKKYGFSSIPLGNSTLNWKKKFEEIFLFSPLNNLKQIFSLKKIILVKFQIKKTSQILVIEYERNAF
jgi:hypothetical protein